MLLFIILIVLISLVSFDLLHLRLICHFYCHYNVYRLYARHVDERVPIS